MFGMNRVWVFLCAPFQWVLQLPFAQQLGLLCFGLAMARFAKRCQKGLVISLSITATALLAAAWLNSRVPLAATVLNAFHAMPLRGGIAAITASAVGFGVLTARATSFTQIKQNRYFALMEGYDQFRFMSHISEDSIRWRCGFGGILYWAVEAGMLYGLSRCPDSFCTELPQAFVTPLLRLLLQGMFNTKTLFAAIAVAGAGGFVAVLFRFQIRKRGPGIIAKLCTLRMILYLVLIAFASVSGAIHLAVACAVSMGLSARYVHLGYCMPQDCVPHIWFDMEERHCLLCGFLEAAAIRTQRRAVVSLAEIGALRRVHTLSESNDALFLRNEQSRDALWHIQFSDGDDIVVCANCRKVFFAEDFTDTCPLCASHDQLWFSHPGALLMRVNTTLASGGTVERPYETAQLLCAQEWQLQLPDRPSIANRSMWLLLPAAMYVIILLAYV